MGEKIGLALFGFAFGAVLIYAGITDKGIGDVFSIRGTTTGDFIDDILLIVGGVILIGSAVVYCIK